jgi:hypothetical protein
MEISRFPCKRLLRMPGSTTTRGQHVSCAIDTRRIAFCGTENIGTPNLSYAAQYLACALPCERFTSALADKPCITGGRCGSLLLHRDGLAYLLPVSRRTRPYMDTTVRSEIPALRQILPAVSRVRRVE